MNILKKGFTLIELIIVIAVLGILAAGLLTALDPVEQLNRATDATNEKKSFDVISAAQRYYASKATPAWPAAVTDLVSAGELKSAPAGVSFAIGTATDGPWACFFAKSKSYGKPLGTTTGAGTKADAGTTTANPTHKTVACTDSEISGGTCRYCVNPK